MQCNGFQPEWTNYDNCILSIRDFVQELHSSVFNSAPTTMYHSIHCLNTNWFGSVLLAQTQMVRGRYVTEWPIWQHVHSEYMNNINDSPPRPPVHIDCWARRILDVTVSDLSEQTLTTQVLPLDSLSKNYSPAFSIQAPLPCTIQHYMLPQTHLVQYF